VVISGLGGDGRILEGRQGGAAAVRGLSNNGTASGDSGLKAACEQ
jgi:hypothetical protein